MNKRIQFGRQGLALAAIALGLMLPAESVSAQGTAIQRPITDFISTQGTFCSPVSSVNCASLFNTAIPIPFIIWSNNINDTPDERSADSLRCAVVDYAGLLARPSFGTTLKGTITDRPLNNGTGQSEVTVTLATNNALTWVFAGDPSATNICGVNFTTQPLLFGTRPANVTASGDNAALGDSHLKVVFTNTAFGAPLPDLIQLVFSPAPGQALRQFSISASANGLLHAAFGVPEGTPGRAHVVQTGLFMTQQKGATADYFPVEMVNLIRTRTRP